VYCGKNNLEGKKLTNKPQFERDYTSQININMLKKSIMIDNDKISLLNVLDHLDFVLDLNPMLELPIFNDMMLDLIKLGIIFYNLAFCSIKPNRFFSYLLGIHAKENKEKGDR